MGKPTQEQLQTAIDHAALLREQGEDIYYIAKALLNLNYRMKFYEDVLHKADLYLHSGEGAVEHAELVRAIERARKSDLGPGETDKDFNF